jgi:hypothetical protein
MGRGQIKLGLKRGSPKGRKFLDFRSTGGISTKTSENVILHILILPEIKAERKKER